LWSALIAKKNISAAFFALLDGDRLTLLEGEAFGLLDFGRGLVDGFAELLETLCYVDVTLDRCADVKSSMVLGPQFGLLFVEGQVEIAFVADEHQLSVGGLGLGQFVPLGGDAGEGCGVGKVEDEHDSVAILEVGGNDGTIFFLSGSVPDVELDGLILDVDISDLEIDSGDGGCLVGQELALDILPEEGGLAHAGIPHHYDLVLRHLVG
jgi:hypothetical protein